MVNNALPTVYVIESHEQNRNRLSRSLMSMQFEVRDFDGAEAFLRESHRCERGCVVADLRLGGMSGLELQARLKKEGSLLPVVLVAERVSTQLIVRAMREGAVAFLDLPINEDDLWLAVRSAISENADRLVREEKKNNLRTRFGQLSDGELQVLTKVREGLTNKEIASLLDVSIRTVESRRRRILQKTSSGSIPELLLTYEQFKNTCLESIPGPAL